MVADVEMSISSRVGADVYNAFGQEEMFEDACSCTRGGSLRAGNLGANHTLYVGGAGGGAGGDAGGYSRGSADAEPAEHAGVRRRGCGAAIAVVGGGVLAFSVSGRTRSSGSAGDRA